LERDPDSEILLMSADSPLLSNNEAAAYLGLSNRTLPGLRRRGGGPPYIKLGGRRVGYLKHDLDAWLESRRRLSTSDPGPKSKDRG
jgi:predicted DNA-binding transcriptional regulator AlpA